MSGIVVANIYLLVIALGLCAMYTLCLVIVPVFFKEAHSAKDSFSLRSVAVILATYTMVVYVVFAQRDVEWGNRLLHTFGGGLCAYLAYALAVRDAKMSQSRWRLVFFGVLVITSLGVINELAEFALSYVVDYEFARNIFDTWFDLTSNTIGLSIGALIMLPVMKKKTPDNLRLSGVALPSQDMINE
ncbi:MAG: hypothetical protein Q8Q18_02765 [bacterium]|nr:hypothetical protein [bacterium]